MRLTLFNLKYVGVRGELDLSSAPIFYKKHDFMSYAWNFDSTNRLDRRGSHVESFYRDLREYELILHVKGGCSEEEYYQLLDDLTNRFEADIAAETPAKLVCNGFYLPCYIVGQTKSDYKRWIHHQEVTLKVLSPYPFPHYA